MKTRLLYKGEQSDKFWEIEVSESSMTINFGRAGTQGQSRTFSLASPEAAMAEAARRVAAKKKKGYQVSAALIPGHTVDSEMEFGRVQIKAALNNLKKKYNQKGSGGILNSTWAIICRELKFKPASILAALPDEEHLSFAHLLAAVDEVSRRGPGAELIAVIILENILAHREAKNPVTDTASASPNAYRLFQGDVDLSGEQSVDTTDSRLFIAGDLRLDGALVVRGTVAVAGDLVCTQTISVENGALLVGGEVRAPRVVVAGGTLFALKDLVTRVLLEAQGRGQIFGNVASEAAVLVENVKLPGLNRKRMLKRFRTDLHDRELLNVLGLPAGNKLVAWSSISYIKHPPSSEQFNDLLGDGYRSLKKTAAAHGGWERLFRNTIPRRRALFGLTETNVPHGFSDHGDFWKEGAIGWSGGKPRGITPEQWPRSIHSGEPMRHGFTIEVPVEYRTEGKKYSHLAAFYEDDWPDEHRTYTEVQARKILETNRIYWSCL